MHIIFDLFHTLVSPEDHWPAGYERETAAAEALGLSPNQFRAFWQGPGQARYTGVPVAALMAEAARRSGREVTSEGLEAALEAYGHYHDMALAKPQPGVTEGLQSLHRQGHRLALLSNADDREVAAWSRSPLSHHIGHVGFSYRLGVAKPDPNAYRMVMDAIGADPSGTAFVGDGGSGEFAGAKSVGIGTVIAVTRFATVNGLRTHGDVAKAAGDADHVIRSVADLPALFSRRWGEVEG